MTITICIQRYILYHFPSKFLNHITYETFQGRLRELLEAAITKELAGQLFSYLESSSQEDILRNLWLMSPSVRDDFKNGHIFVERGEFVTDSVSIPTDPGNLGHMVNFAIVVDC